MSKTTTSKILGRGCGVVYPLSRTTQSVEERRSSGLIHCLTTIPLQAYGPSEPPPFRFTKAKDTGSPSKAQPLGTWLSP
ncbi:hypothetical protein MCOR19_007111 [Pyricularia oryzae]|nr:hypothetical protein MCOR19_007111 [Pyricularia oryzae]KAI6328362.1 hypothetical protein MCOR34_000168 [Pyricularia oryzae]KAI6376329.1 hypothetical protein MCOR32_005057 [Pyricularia oryzae]KAI6506610.1 hypothetical protein MCOR13_003364 [Pyricularia oryzae]